MAMSKSNQPTMNEPIPPQGKNDCVRKRKFDFSSGDIDTKEEICKKIEDGQPEGHKSLITDIKKDGKHQALGNQEMDSDDVIKELMSEIKMCEERLRKLKMTKMYREKNNLEELGNLIEKWRNVSQQALEDLLELHPSPQPSMTDLLKHLQIDFELIQFNQEDETFA